MRVPVIAANWKMHKTVEEAENFVKDFLPAVSAFSAVELVICPPFTSLSRVAALLPGSRVRLGAQNMHWENQGAYTGEISGLMLKNVGVTHVILGHSERRHIFGEANQDIKRKVEAALEYGLCPVLCVGEKEGERRAGMTEAVIGEQLRTALMEVSEKGVEQVIVAYEPVWAIGTGNPSTGTDAQEVAAFLRRFLKEMFGPHPAEKVRILYGGSVKPENIGEFMKQPDIDGALVGGASLQVKSFIKLAHAGLQAKG